MQTIDKPLQFGIRHLLGTMFVVALLSALLAPWVRGWSAGQWLALAAQTAAVGVTFTVCLVGHTWRRRVIRRRLGVERFRVTARPWGGKAWEPSGAYVMIGFAIFMLLFQAASTIAAGGKLDLPYVQGIYAGMFAGLGTTQLCDPPDQMLVGQHGVALGLRFIPWNQLWFAYEPEVSAAPLFLKTPGWAFEVSPDADTEQALAEYLGQRARPWNNPPQRWKKSQLREQ